MRHFFSFLTFLSCLTFLFTSFAYSEIVTFSDIQLKVKENTYHLEYADTFERRAQGLMNRTSLCENCGMLFKFIQPKVAGFWMKNTLFSLDIAFVRADGVITDIKNMKAHDLNTTRSSEAVLYAWEMNLGWFVENGIQVGDTVVVSEK